MNPAIFTAVVATLFASVPAQATIISRTYTIKASGYGAGAPVDPVVGSFALLFDNSADIPPTTSGISVIDLNLTVAHPTGFTYKKTGDIIAIATLGKYFGAYGGYDSFGFAMIDALSSSHPASTDLAYSYGQKIYDTYNTQVYAFNTSGVPEPSSWAIASVGIGTLGAALRRRRAVIPAPA